MSFKEERDARHWEAVGPASDLLEEQDFEGALRLLKEVISKDAQNAYAYNLLGTALWELKQLEPAKDAFRAAVLVSPEFLGARVSLSHALRRLGHLREAEKEARLAVSRRRDDGDAHYALALTLAAQGQRKVARTSLEIFLASKPEFEAATEARSLLEMLDQGQEDEGIVFDDE